MLLRRQSPVAFSLHPCYFVLRKQVTYELYQIDFRKKHLQQKDILKLASPKITKQSTSRYINRQRKIPSVIASYWARKLKVPSTYFVDADGYCKLLTTAEMYELQNFLAGTPTSENEQEYSSAIEVLERKQSLDVDIRKIQKRIREDIHYAEDTEDVISALDIFESNATFYKELLSLRKASVLSSEEWQSVLNALWLLTSKTADRIVAEDLTGAIYNTIITHRMLMEQKRQKDVTDYISLFRELPSVSGHNPDDNCSPHNI